jgi:hypothetical protein
LRFIAELQTTFQDRDGVESGLFVILNIRHVQKAATDDDSGSAAGY